MSEEFKFDVFLSYHPEAKSAVSRLVKRLKADGLRIWFDDWNLLHKDNITLKTKEGLKNSRIFVLIISTHLFDSNWPQIEKSTALFRNSVNETRQFIPLLLDECQIPESIRRYKFINWIGESEAGYQGLVEACRQIVITPVKHKPVRRNDQELKFVGHTNWVWTIIIPSEHKTALSGSADKTIRLWDLRTGKCLKNIPQSEGILSLTMTPNGKGILVATRNNSFDLWDFSNWGKVRTFHGHSSSVFSIAVTPDGKRILSSSGDRTLKLWNLSSGDCIATFIGHKDIVRKVAVTPDGQKGLSASYDQTLKLWDLNTGKCITTLLGHTDHIMSVHVTPDGNQAISVSTDNTVRIWDLPSRSCMATLEGHKGAILGLDISAKKRLATTASSDKTIKIWDIDSGACLQTIMGTDEFLSVTLLPDQSHLLAGSGNGGIFLYSLKSLNIKGKRTKAMPEVRYTNAKVVLLGESGVGKSGLSYRLAENRWVTTDSTHGMKVWSLELPRSSQKSDVEREVWLWDLAGQPEYRLVHQLFLEETSLALVLFNAQADDPFKDLGDWEKALRMAVKDPVKLLVAARTDRGGATFTQDKIVRFYQEHGYSGYFATSAKQDEGCKELKRALIDYIPWDRLPWTSTTKLFKTLKDALVRLKDEGIVLARFSELRQRLQIMVPDEMFKEEDLRAVIGLVAGQGLVKKIDFGDFILLQPEQLNNYASTVIRNAREHTDGIGCINELNVLEAKFDFKDMTRLGNADEEILLPAMVQTFLDQSLCIREETPFGVQLVFPSQFNREMEIPSYPYIFITYRFSGHLPTIYTTLVVRLSYSNSFEKKDLWKNAAEFLTPEGKIVGLVMKRVGEGVGEIKIFFDVGVPDDTRVIFIKYVHEHLLKRANNVEREREYFCPNCGKPVNDREIIKERIKIRKKDIGCARCDERIPLFDLIERRFNEDKFLKLANDLDVRAGINLDNESRELILVGQAISIAGEAGQIFRQYANSDHGIDGEIEFKDNNGEASGKRLYLQLKSGDSYLYERRHKVTEKIARTDRDENYEAGQEIKGTPQVPTDMRDIDFTKIRKINSTEIQEIFTVKKDRHLRYWLNQAYPVYLVIRTSDGVIRWMNITKYLQQRTDKASKQIVFKGGLFNAQTLRNIRDKYIL